MIALIVLVAMTMAGIAMVRSTDTGNLISGNSAFRTAALHTADYGVEAAFAQVVSTFSASPTAAVTSTAGLYFPVINDADSNGLPDVDWTTIIGTVGRGRDEDLVGIARGDSETWRQLPDSMVAQTGFDVNRLRLLVGEQTLLGAIVMGDQKLSFPLQKLISGRVDISPMRERLLAPNAEVANIVADFWATRESQFRANLQ